MKSILENIQAGKYEQVLDWLEQRNHWENTECILKIWMEIACSERRLYGESKVLDNCADIDSMIAKYYTLRFMLRRIEMQLPQEYLQEAIEYLKEQEITDEAIRIMVHQTSVDVINTLNFLARLYIQNGWYQRAMNYLTYANGLCSDDIETIKSYRFIAEKLNDKVLYEECNKLLEQFGNLEEISKEYNIKDMEKKRRFAFIVCVSQEDMFSESAVYIRQLHREKEWEVEIIPVGGARGICHGYNQGMEKAKDADYKIYIHQDTFILNRDILYALVELFENQTDIGMIGLAGSETIPENGIWWESEDSVYNATLQTSPRNAPTVSKGVEGKKFAYVQAIDGVFMATNRDIRWREDIIKGWNFYDISQSIEFRKKGYQIVVPKMDGYWILHDGKISLQTYRYEEDREIFLNHYS